MNTVKLLLGIQRGSVTFETVTQAIWGETPPKNFDFLKAANRDDILHVTFSPAYSRNSNPSFSIVLPTYNRKEKILTVFRTLELQKGVTKDDYEIIIVNDGSTDQTEQVIRSYLSLTSEKALCVTLRRNCGGAAARNIGILHARGPLIAFTDDDCMVPENWLSWFKEKFNEDAALVGAGGFKIPSPAAPRTKINVYDAFMCERRAPYMAVPYKSKELSVFNNCGDTANVCYKKKVLEKVGGFNIFITTWYDWELKKRLHQENFSLLYAPRHVLHDADYTLRSFAKYWFILGWDSLLSFKLHPGVPVFENSLPAVFRRISSDIKTRRENKKNGAPGIPAPSYLFLSVLSNLCFWFGKYWTPVFILNSKKI